MKKYTSIRPLSAVAQAFAALVMGSAAHAQSASSSTGLSSSNWIPAAGQRYIGLNGGNTDLRLGDNSTAYDIYAGGLWNKNFGLELGMTDFGKIRRPDNSVEAYGFSVKAVGMMPLTESFGAFVKLGTMYTRTKVSTASSDVSDNGWGATYGLGLNFDITRQFAAVLEWDRTNMNLAGSSDHINTTSVGLKYRF